MCEPAKEKKDSVAIANVIHFLTNSHHTPLPVRWSAVHCQPQILH